jgi:imidazolonepropionase-like amidohydrolase
MGWHGKEAELLVKEVGLPPMEATVANTSRNAWLMGVEGEVGVIASGPVRTHCRGLGRRRRGYADFY